MASAPIGFPLLGSQYESSLFGGLCDARSGLPTADARFRDVRLQTGEIVRYELLMRDSDTLIYAHGLTLCEVMDLLVNHYCIGDSSC